MDECKQALNEDEMGQVNGGASVTVSNKYQCPTCGSYVEKWTSRRALGGAIVQYYCPTCKERVSVNELVMA